MMKFSSEENKQECYGAQREFINALVKLFGLPPDQVMNGSHIETDGTTAGTLNAVFVVALSQCDLIHAGRILNGESVANAERPSGVERL